MVDGFKNRVSSEDNTIAIIAAVIWEWSVPHKKSGTFVFLKLNACVADKVYTEC